MLLPCLMMMQTRKPSTTTSVPSYGRTVSFKDRLFLLGDFNARVGLDAQTWPRFLGQHSVGNENSNGSLLLQTCSEHELAITNTYIQQANKYKTTWHSALKALAYDRSRHHAMASSERCAFHSGYASHRNVVTPPTSPQSRSPGTATATFDHDDFSREFFGS